MLAKTLSEAVSRFPIAVPVEEPIAISTLMDRRPLLVHQELRVDALCAQLIGRRTGGAPVVDGDGRPIGFVSMTDIVGDHERTGAGSAFRSRWDPELAGELEDTRLGAATVGQIMTPFVFSLP